MFSFCCLRFKVLSKYDVVSSTILPQFLYSDIHFHYLEQYKVCFVVKAYFSVLCCGYSRPAWWQRSQSLAFIMNEIWMAQHLENGTDHHNSKRGWDLPNGNVMRRCRMVLPVPPTSAGNRCPRGHSCFPPNVRVFIRVQVYKTSFQCFIFSFFEKKKENTDKQRLETKK